MLEAVLFPRKLAFHFLFLTLFHFMLDPDQHPVPLSKKLGFWFHKTA
jgi:hypothetical protein